MGILSKGVNLLFLPHKFFNFRISSKHIAIVSSILFLEAVLNLLLLLTVPKTELMAYIFERSASLIDKQSIERIVTDCRQSICRQSFFVRKTYKKEHFCCKIESERIS
ncbi:MAG: hypothetical protein PWQ91_1047, partial [Eubacteriales bacterium]|nr:hypothetical protein [Eubacteriales bacterium]